MARIPRSACALAALACAAGTAAAAAIPTTLHVNLGNYVSPTLGPDGKSTGYPHLALRGAASESCWISGDFGTTAKSARNGRDIVFDTSVRTDGWCSPTSYPIQYPHYMLYSLVILEQGGDWQPLTLAGGASKRGLVWSKSMFPSPTDGFMTDFAPPSGSTLTSPGGRTVCVSGTGYVAYPMLFTRDTLGLAVTDRCEAARAAPRAGTRYVGVRPGGAAAVMLGVPAAGVTWTRAACSGATADAPRRVRGGAVGTLIRRQTPGRGQCTFVRSTPEGPATSVTVVVRAG